MIRSQDGMGKSQRCRRTHEDYDLLVLSCLVFFV